MRTPKRHEARDGSVTWRVRYRERGRQTTQTFTSPQLAADFCRALDSVGVGGALGWLEDELDGNRGDVPTVDQWADTYIDTRTKITDGTRVSYRRLWARTWQPLVGYLPIDRLDNDRVRRGVNELSGRYSDKSVANAHGLLAGMLNAAVKRGLVSENPCEDIDLPRRTEHEREDMRLLSHEDFAAIQAEMPAHYLPLLLTLAGTGMRWGEAEALEVRSVRLNKRTPDVTITQAVKWDPSKSTRDVGPPKTIQSRRTVTLPPQVADALRPLVAGRDADERVFVAPRGGPLRHRTFHRDIWRPALWRAQHCPAHRDPACRCGTAHPDRCKVHDHSPGPCGDGLLFTPRIHDLRHSHVAWLIEQGIGLPVIQRRLGHKSITTTIDVYGHLMPDLQVQAAAAAQLVLGSRPALEA